GRGTVAEKFYVRLEIPYDGMREAPRGSIDRGQGPVAFSGISTTGGAPMSGPVSPAAETAIVHIVDDDVPLAAALESLFRSMGLEARTYGSARAFLEAQHPDRPGCLVLDIRLPGVSGLDFQAQLAELGIH